MRARKRWLEELHTRFALMLDEYGEESAAVKAFARWYKRDAEARQVLAGVRLLKAVFGSAIPSNWKHEDLPSNGGPHDPD